MSSGIKLFNRASSVETRFHKSFSFQSKSKTSNILKCKDGVFNIRRKLILKSDVRSPSLYSQSVWDTMIIDTTVLIMISIWEEHLTKIKENSVYYIRNMKMLNFNGISFTTQWFAKFSETESFEMVDFCVKEIICCPEIINNTANVYQICNNPNYRKKTICSCRGDTSNMFLLQKVTFKKGIIRVKCSCPIRSILWVISYVYKVSWRSYLWKNA